MTESKPGRGGRILELFSGLLAGPVRGTVGLAVQDGAGVTR